MSRPFQTFPALLALLTLTACGSKGSFSGTVTDGLTGDPVDGLRLLARAQATDDLTCKVVESPTTPTGTFTITNTCGGVTYDLESADRSWILAGAASFDGAESTAEVAVKAWRAPEGTGVYVLAEGALTPVRTASDMSSLPLWKQEETVRYPDGIPKRVTKLSAGQHLLIVGKDDIERLAWTPLIKHEGELRFGDPKHYFDMDPWWYAGVRFESRDKYEKVEATLDTSKLTDVSEGDRQVRYVPHGALPTGRYVLVGPDDRRTYIVDFD